MKKTFLITGVGGFVGLNVGGGDGSIVGSGVGDSLGLVVGHPKVGFELGLIKLGVDVAPRFLKKAKVAYLIFEFDYSD